MSHDVAASADLIGLQSSGVIKTYHFCCTHMRDLNYQLKQLCKARREGSYASRDRRHSDLQLMANQLHGMGYRCMGTASLKRKHVQALAHKWLEQGLAPGTIKNRMASLRWWAKQVNKQNVVAKTNDFYAIPHRQFVTNTDKSIQEKAWSF